MMLDVSSLWDVFDKHVEMYVPWDKIRSMSRQVKAEDILGVVTPKMIFMVVALGLFIWNLRRRSVCRFSFLTLISFDCFVFFDM